MQVTRRDVTGEWEPGTFNFSYIVLTNESVINDVIVPMYDVITRQYWTLILIVFPLLTVLGNVLVCTSVAKERSLQTLTNYLIVSLAVADFLVAVLVMPLAVYVEVSKY